MNVKPAFFEGANWIWMNGNIVPWEAATAHISVHGLHYGTGVFEGIRAYQTPTGAGIFRLDAHLDRLSHSAAAYSMNIPYSSQALSEAVYETLQANSLAGNSYIRVLCWYGSHDLMLGSYKWPVETAIMAAPGGSFFSPDLLRSGLRVAICPWRKIHHSMLPTTAKACGQYLSSILASRFAHQNKSHEALLLDVSGNLAEGPAENIFLVKDGKLLTNDEKSSILMGITRDSVIQIARDLGIPVEVRALTPEDLFTSDDAFFTGTAVEIIKIREVDGKLIGSGERSAVLDKIHHIFGSVTSGGSDAYRHWMQSASDSVLTAAAV